MLTVLADLDDEAELWDADRVGGDDRIVVLHTHGAVEERDGPESLDERRVTFRPVLTLPHDPDLAPSDLLGYRDLYDATAPEIDDHLLLGHPRPVQYDSREPGEVSVLQLGWDEELGLEYLDAGTIGLIGTPDALRAGRWDELRVDVQSC